MCLELVQNRLWKEYSAPFERLQKPVSESSGEEFYRRFNALISEIAFVDLEAADHPKGLDLLMQLKPPEDGRAAGKAGKGEFVLKFHGLVNSVPDPQDDPADQEFGYDLWETLQVGQKTLGHAPFVRHPVKGHGIALIP